MENMEVLLDTNIVLDSLLQREPFAKNADAIIDLCESGKVQGFLACHTFPNVFYILRKHFSTEERKDILFLLAKTFTVIGIDVEMILGAISAENFQDLEDSLQTECAVKMNLDFIITRDPKGFTSSQVPILSSNEFLQKMKANR
ncbi:MAG: PIN domain-containing protein [Defluviitaleaceae bacterium]|nr:PIN domain-containing protein [Defluviitaleaceae bacterium]MCL2262243.1 PIN domain-containing protein [Defluviitaleaceae bacterium]